MLVQKMLLPRVLIVTPPLILNSLAGSSWRQGVSNRSLFGFTLNHKAIAVSVTFFAQYLSDSRRSLSSITTLNKEFFYLQQEDVAISHRPVFNMRLILVGMIARFTPPLR